jgi:hypothetical protein
VEEAKTEETPGLPRNPPLPVTDKELAALDAAIAKMAKTGRERGVWAETLRAIRENGKLCRQADELISDTLTSLKKDVKDDAAEKLFERLAKVVDDWQDRDEQMSLGVVFIRFMDTMTYFVAYKQKFRGVARTSSISKSDALAVLKERGLTRKS